MFVQRLERADVAYELVPLERSAVAVSGADLVLVEADAVGSHRAVVPIGSAVVAAVARAAAVPVWLVAGRGRRLPDPMIDAMLARLGRCERDHEPLALRLVTDVAGPDGRTPISPVAVAAECSMVAELLRQSPM
jgi:hypothetical protein